MEEIPENSYPLTPLQQGMVYHSLLALQSGVYVQQLAGHLHEKLNAGCFKEAWQRVAARHPALRTRFYPAGAAEYVQEVETDAAAEWTEDDWSGLTSDERETRWRRYLREDRRRGFDFSRSRLMRLALFRLADDEYLFLWTYYHALLDGRSQFLVVKELFGFYEALCAGKEYQAGYSPPYHHFVHWLSRQDPEHARDFWREALEGFTTPTQLAVAGASGHPGAQEDERATQEIRLTGEATGRLQSFAAEHGLTVGTLVQGAWAALLARYSGDEDIVFGATRACRHSSVEGAESMVGLLINTVPLRVRVDSDTAALAWLKTIRSKWVAMRPYEHTPLRDIQAWSGFGPDRPLFESILVYEDYSLNEALWAQGGNWTRREFELFEKGNYPLAALGYGGSRLLLRLGYDRRRFDDAAAGRMLGHWQTLLAGLAAHPDERVGELPLLTDAERRMILVDWNSTQREYPRHMCLHQLVEAQAAKTPDKAAVLFGDERLTYDDLNTRANQLAHHLQGAGVAPEVRVAVCLGRTPALVIGVLAVLKAGGAYVPLDPDYPREQLSSMLADSGASVLLTQGDLLERLPRHGLRTVVADTDGEAIARESGANPESSVLPENLAYAIYTSGSTGRPKLIGVEHRSAVNVVFFTTHAVFAPEELAVVPFADSISFDASVYRIFSPLSAGGSIIVLESLFALANCRHAGSITVLGGAPSVLKALLEDFAPPESVRAASIGGEAASEDLIEQLAAYPQINRIVNFYGPTETTIYCSHAVLVERRMGSAEAGSVAPVSRAARANIIGRPISNVQMYILDARLGPVPIGVTGEVCVGGDCLARGYLNEPELTAERFVANPFTNDRGARLYKTGDLGRYLPDGSIEFAGRIDNQVKIRGFRVEPQGIEAALNQHPAVRESVVRAAEDPSGQKYLVAYVVPVSREAADSRDSGSVDANELRRYLERKLPRQMIPRTFVLLDELPRNSTGKLDFRALPEPILEAGGPKRRFVAPRTQVERTLAEIWKEVLAVREVGVHDGFLELGGDSLSAIRIVNRVNRAFGTEFSVRVIFDAPTVTDMAHVVSLGLARGSEEQQQA